MVTVFSAETKTYGELLQNLEIVYGLDEGLEEAKDITRGEMIVLLVRMLVGESEFNGYVLPEIPSFNDVPSSHWAYTEIEIAKQIGITSGLDDGSFVLICRSLMLKQRFFLQGLCIMIPQPCLTTI